MAVIVAGALFIWVKQDTSSLDVEVDDEKKWKEDKRAAYS
jgi:hypothetical protein